MTQYPDDFVNRLHLIWGPGFLSPGGPEEVRTIVDGLRLKGARVLDIGCGTGGPAVVLAKEMGAQLVCIDVEESLLQRARQLAAHEGLSDRIKFELVQPGALPFADSSFDVVFSKDALIHVSDKAGLYDEILRVLKPSGYFVASDWLCGQNAAEDPSYRAFLKAVHLEFVMVSAEEAATILRKAGFANVRTVDRNAWFAMAASEDVKAIEGELREQVIAVSSEQTWRNWLSVRRLLEAAAKSGSLRPTHLRGTRPV